MGKRILSEGTVLTLASRGEVFTLEQLQSRACGQRELIQAGLTLSGRDAKQEECHVIWVLSSRS